MEKAHMCFFHNAAIQSLAAELQVNSASWDLIANFVRLDTIVG